jgi:hypothetical protein
MSRQIVLGTMSFNLDYEHRVEGCLTIWAAKNKTLLEWCTDNLTDWDYRQIKISRYLTSRYGFEAAFYYELHSDEDMVAWSLRPEFN